MEIALKTAMDEFISARQENHMHAMQRAALQIVAGIDLDKLMTSTGEEKMQLRGRLNRLIERERLKGLRGHWSYDLNRHIALKQALDRLEGRSIKGRKNRRRIHN